VRLEFEPGTAKRVQRRDFFRLDVVTDLVITREGHLRELKTHTLDLSASGLLLPPHPGLTVGDRVRVSIDVGDSPPVRGHARVARITEKNHVGPEFDLIEGFQHLAGLSLAQNRAWGFAP
jgi:c-di-GMP-binding flagellar brake protein YcgR